MDSAIQLSSHIKLLGVIFDYALTCYPHMSDVCCNSYYHNICSLHWIHPLLDLETSKLIASVTESRINSANCLLCGIPAYIIQHLQRVQNLFAHVITAQGFQGIISSAYPLASLHWLPILQRISFKLCALVHGSLCNTVLHRLSSLLRHLNNSDHMIVYAFYILTSSHLLMSHSYWSLDFSNRCILTDV